MKYILCSVGEGGNGVDFRRESRLMTLRDLKLGNDVKCIKYNLSQYCNSNYRNLIQFYM